MDADDELELQTTDDPNIQDSASFVPVVVRKMTEEESIRKSVQECQSAAPKLTTVSWPQVGDSPISEFTMEGYILCAFPTLLPIGEAEFLSPRQNTVTIGNYFKHLMRYGDGQFAKHSQSATLLSTDWQDIHQPAPIGYPSHPRKVETHGWKGRRVLQQQSVALCQ